MQFLENSAVLNVLYCISGTIQHMKTEFALLERRIIGAEYSKIEINN